MSNPSALFRSLVIYGLCLPLAACLGYLLATPLDPTTFLLVGAVLFTMMIPALLRWHHVWLIASWNLAAVVFFLPGRPGVWMLLSLISVCIGVFQYSINRNFKFLHVPSMVRPLLFLLAVVLITARLTGGIGLRSLGSPVQGGRYYVGIIAAVIGYFALVSRPIPPKRAELYVTLFFLGGATLAIGELPRVLPAAFDYLFLIFPVIDVNTISGQSQFVYSGIDVLHRVVGLGGLGASICWVMLARYGISGIFLEPGKLWRPLVLAACVFIGLLGGFRSILILMMMTFLVLFYLERLHHTRFFLVFVLAAVLGGTLMVTFANRMPMAVQRSMAFLPIDIDPAARLSAEASTEWRLQIWEDILPQVKDYWLLGKGYGFSAREMAAMFQTSHGGADMQVTEMTGDYHNGPLSVIIPFGVFGMLGFLWFLWAGFRVVYQNYRFGNPAYLRYNTFLLAYFMVKAVFFFVVFGGLTTDFIQFVGLIGLSISLNSGVAKPVVVPQPKVVFNRFQLHPGVRRPLGV
jgi:O-antigen ligase